MKKNLVTIIKKKYSKLKKKKIKLDTDLLNDMIFDSLEIVGFLTFLEKNHNFNIKKYVSKNKKFIVRSIEEQLNKN